MQKVWKMPCSKALGSTLLSFFSCMLLVFPDILDENLASHAFPLNVLATLSRLLTAGSKGMSTQMGLLSLPLYYFYFTYYKAPQPCPSRVKRLAGFLAFLIFFGFYPLNILEMFTSKLFTSHIWIELPFFGGLYLLLKVLLHRLFLWADGLPAYPVVLGNKGEDRRSFWKFFVLIALCWLPFLLLQYPGNLPSDTEVQLHQVLITGQYDAANPLFLSLAYGGLFALGSLINDNFGLFLAVFVQMLCLAASFAYVLLQIRRMALPTVAGKMAFFFFAISPVWSFFIHALLKDVAHTAAFTWFMVEFLRQLEEESFTRSGLIRFGLACALTVLTRVTGLYLLFPCLLLLFFSKCKSNGKAKSWLLRYGSLALVLFSLNPLLQFALHAEKRSMTDNLGWIFQMTAAYSKKHQQEMTAEEIAIIDSVLDFDAIVHNYSTTSSDPVKATFSFVNRADFYRYMGLWAKHFIKDPEVYLMAFITGGYFYWSPGYDYRPVPLNVMDPDLGRNLYFVFSSEIRSISEHYWAIWRNVFALGWLVKGASYAYLLFIGYAYAGHRGNKKAKLLFAPAILLFVGCLFSPISGDFRYMAPYAASLPLLLCYVLQKAQREEVYSAALK